MISTKFWSRRVSAESTGDFLQNRFSATFGSHLDFLHKAQNRIYFAGYLQSVLATFCKNHFPAFFGGHLDFLRKTQNTFIFETVRDFDEILTILTKFLTCRLSAESTGDFSQKSLSRHLWRSS